MKQYNRVGTFIRVFSSKNTCLRLPDIIFFVYYTCFLVEILGFVLALRSPLQANLKIPCKTLRNVSPFRCKKKALSNAKPKTLDCACEINVFYEFFDLLVPTQSAGTQHQPEPGHGN